MELREHELCVPAQIEQPPLLLTVYWNLCFTELSDATGSRMQTDVPKCRLDDHEADVRSLAEDKASQRQQYYADSNTPKPIDAVS